MKDNGKSANTSIFDAAADGDLKILMSLVDQNKDSVHSTLFDGSTPLMKASANGHFNVVEFLIQEGANVNAIDKWGYSALLWAVDYHIAGLNVVSYLVERKADIQIKDKQKGYSPLHWAAKNGDLEIVKYLIEKGALIYEKSREGEMPFHLAAANNRINVLQYFTNERGVQFDIFEAAERGYTDAVRDFIERKKKKSDAIDPNGLSVLHRAANGGHLETVKYLIEKANADVNANNLRIGTPATPLHAATEKGHIDVAKFLVREGADVNAKDVLGRTALYWAVNNGHLNLVEYFIDTLNGDLSSEDKFGKVLLHAACSNSNLEVVRYLVEKKRSNLNAQDHDGRTPLMESIQQDKFDIFDYLITQTSSDLNLKITDKNGNNVVHYLADKGNLKAIRELVGKKIDFNLRNIGGLTPLDYASKAGHFEMVKYLIDELEVTYDEGISSAAEKGYLGLVKYLVEEKGAQVDTKDDDGRTPLYLATVGVKESGGHLNVIQYLVDEKNGDVHQRNSEGYTLLHGAVMSGPLEVVKYLVEKQGLDVNALDNQGFTVLFDAVYANRFDIFMYLVEEKSADFKSMTPWGTCLHEAATRGYLNFVKVLVDKGADITSRDSSGHTPVYYAANGKQKNSGGHLNVLRYFVDEKRANVYQKDKEGQTLLHAAAMSGPIEVVKYLVEEKGLDVNAKDKEGYTVLYDSIYEGKFNIFRYLMNEKSADFRTNTPEGTCLHLAATWGYTDFVKALVNKGANINERDEIGRTPVFNAADGKGQSNGGHLAVLRYLLDEKKADARQKDQNGNSLLHAASLSGPVELFKYLVAEKGLDINVKNNEGFTVLFNSVSANKFTIFKYLMEEKSADPRVPTPNGTCLHEASRRGYGDFVKILVEKGADVNAKDKSGRTPAFYAANGRHRNVLQYLESKGGRKSRRRRNAGFSQEVPAVTNSAHTPYSTINYIAQYTRNFVTNFSLLSLQSSRTMVENSTNYGYFNGLLMLLNMGYRKASRPNFEYNRLESEHFLSPDQLIEGRMDLVAPSAINGLFSLFDEES